MNEIAHHQPSIQAIVLAAGKSTRFKGKTTKLLTPLCGQPIIMYLTQLLESLDIATTLVVGHEAAAIQTLVGAQHKAVQFAQQTEQRGTGHALKSSEPLWHADHLLILNGDCPLIHAHTLKYLATTHAQNNNAVTFVTAHHPNPFNAYGRVIKKNKRISIVEARDLPDDPTKYDTVNAGIYIMQTAFLKKYMHLLGTNNAAQEYYITDLVGIAQNQGLRVGTISASFDEICGINTLPELMRAEQVQRSRIIYNHIENGVIFRSTDVYIDTPVTIQPGTVVGAGVHLLGNSTIGQEAVLAPYCIVENSTIADNVTVHEQTIIKHSRVEAHAAVGPFAFVTRSTIDAHETVKSFVSVANDRVGTVSNTTVHAESLVQAPEVTLAQTQRVQLNS
ncbi:MAG: NTP transferase domain-containing protein [Candidatus Babeliales bacterium]